MELQNRGEPQKWGYWVNDLTSSSPEDVEEALGCKCVANTLDITMQLTHGHKQLTKNKYTHTELARKNMNKKKTQNFKLTFRHVRILTSSINLLQHF